MKVTPVTHKQRKSLNMELDCEGGRAAIRFAEGEEVFTNLPTGVAIALFDLLEEAKIGGDEYNIAYRAFDLIDELVLWGEEPVG